MGFLRGEFEDLIWGGNMMMFFVGGRIGISGSLGFDSLSLVCGVWRSHLIDC